VKLEVETPRMHRETTGSMWNSQPHSSIASASYRAGRTLETLKAVDETMINVALCRRTLLASRIDALARWARTSLPTFDEVVTPGAFDAAAALVGLENEDARGWLREDIHTLMSLFAERTGCARLRVALRAVQTDSCRKFHTDFVHLRLLTTYVGPGTHWVPAHGVCREALDRHIEDPCEANRAIVPDPALIHRARTGDVLVLKGERACAGSGAVHRSPPVQARRLTRLVLTITTADHG
jgi:hypothetical protein